MAFSKFLRLFSGNATRKGQKRADKGQARVPARPIFELTPLEQRVLMSTGDFQSTMIPTYTSGTAKTSTNAAGLVTNYYRGPSVVDSITNIPSVQKVNVNLTVDIFDEWIGRNIAVTVADTSGSANATSKTETFRLSNEYEDYNRLIASDDTYPAQVNQGHVYPPGYAAAKKIDLDNDSLNNPACGPTSIDDYEYGISISIPITGSSLKVTVTGADDLSGNTYFFGVPKIEVDPAPAGPVCSLANVKPSDGSSRTVVPGPSSDTGVDISNGNSSLSTSGGTAGTNSSLIGIGGFVQNGALEIIGTNRLTGEPEEYYLVTDNTWESSGFPDQIITYDPSSGNYTLDPDGAQTIFYGFGGSTPAGLMGKVQSTIDQGGNTTTYTYDPTSYIITSTASTPPGSTPVTTTTTYSYLTTPDPNAGMLSSILIQQTPYGGSPQNVRQTVYTYYTTGDTNGNLGNLKTATTEDGSGNPIDESYYRYYTPAAATGISASFAGGTTTTTVTAANNLAVGDWVTLSGVTQAQFNGAFLVTAASGTSFSYQFAGSASSPTGSTITFVARGLQGLVKDQVGPAAFARLAAALSSGTTPLTATDAQIAPYTDVYYEYDGQGRVVKRIQQGAGCSACSGGQGTYTYSYGTSSEASGYNNNSWATKTTETDPDNTVITHYYNNIGAEMLTVTQDGVTGKMYGTYTQYDSAGRVVLTAQPSAVLLPTSLSTLEQYADLLDNTAPVGATPNYLYLADNSGMVQTTDYYNVGWTFTGTGGIASNGSPEMNSLTAPAGTQAAFLTDKSSISQSITIATTNFYTLSVSAALTAGTSQTFDIYFDGALVDKVTGINSSSFSTWTSSFSPSLAAGTHTYMIQGENTGQTVLVDSVQFTTGTTTFADAGFESPTLAAGVQVFNPKGSTATITTAGGMTGYQHGTYVKQGELGTAIPTDILDYYSNVMASAEVYPVADDTTYGLDSGTASDYSDRDPRTTHYAYTWYSGTLQQASETVTAPNIASGQNGPGTADTTSTYYDTYGRPIWTLDGDGHVNYTAYDQATGAMTQSIIDVNYSSLTTDQQTSFGLTGWSNPSGLNFVTTSVVDSLGRTTKQTSPAGNITYTVYNDTNHETRVYPGWTTAATGTATSTGSTSTLVCSSLTGTSATYVGRSIVITSGTDVNSCAAITAYNAATHTLTFSPAFASATDTSTAFLIAGTTGPIQVSREYRPAANSGNVDYTEMLTSTAAPVMNASGVPLGTETLNQTNIVSLQRNITNAAGQMVESNKYSNLTDVTYSTASAHLGTRSFARTDPFTQTNWSGVYGAQGNAVAGATASWPTSGTYNYLSAAPTMPSTTTSGGHTYWTSGLGANTTFTLDLNMTDTAVTHQISLYMVDYGASSRIQRVEVLDSTGANVLDTQTLSNFTSGIYLSFNVSGHIKLKFTNLAGAGKDAVLTGIFFDHAGNYDPTLYAYAPGGYQNRVVSPTGTITRTVYGGMGQVLSKWVGTYDTPGTGFWSTSNNTAPSNMMDVEDDSYDQTHDFISAPSAPTLTQAAGGALAARTYYVKVTYLGTGGQTLASSESTIPVSANNLMSVTSPSAATGATKYNIYVGTSSGTEMLQNPTPMTLGTNWKESTSGIFTGLTAPVAPGLYETTGGSWSSTVYHVRVTYVTANGETLGSPEAGCTVDAGSLLNIVSPGAISGATGYNVYVGTGSGQDVLQNSSPLTIGTDWTQSASTALTTTPLPPYNPFLGQTSGGTMPATKYYVTLSYVGSRETTWSAEISYSVSANNLLTVSSPSTATGMTGYNIYIGTSPGAETRQNSQPIAIGTDWTMPTTGMASIIGQPVPQDVGEGNLTQVTAHVDTTAGDNRVTQYVYDFRDRQVAAKSGVKSSEDTTTYRPITYTVYDNADEATEQDSYSGDTISLWNLGFTGSLLNRPSPSSLRAKMVSSYDDQGRTYRTQVYSVDQTNGTLGTALTADTFYDHRGNTIAAFDPSGQVAKSVFDGAGRVTTQYTTDGGAVNNSNVAQKDWTHATSVSSDLVLTQADYAYDADGNVILSTSHDRFDNDATSSMGALGSAGSGIGARASYMAAYYDAADRLTDQVNVGTNGGSAYTRPGPVPTRSDTVLVTHTDYDGAGNVADTYDPRNIMTQYINDMLGQELEEINASTGGSPPTGTQVTQYTYDGDGHVLTMTAFSGTNQTTAYVYGVGGTIGTNLFSNDLIARVEYPDKSTGRASTLPANNVSSTYDLLGETLTKTDQNGNVHTYSYDLLGRPTLDAVTTLGSGVDGSIRAVGTTYKDMGLPFQQTNYSNAAGTTVVNQVQNVFNGLGELITQYQEHSGAVNTGTSLKIQYAYDTPANGARIMSLTYPNGRVLNYAYSTGLNADISRISSLADAAGTGAGSVASYTYLGLGTIVQELEGNTIELTYIKQSGESNGDAGDQYIGLDRFGRVVDQRWIPASSPTSPTDRFQYAYDRAGNVLYKNNKVSSSFSELYHANSSSSGDNATAYDSVNRVTGFRRGTLSASANNGGVLDTVTTVNTLAKSTQSWTLDALGNWTSSSTDGTATSRTTNSQNQVTGVGATSLVYDNNGNITTDDQGHTLIYDAWNRLISDKNGATVLASYVYDASGNRVKRTASAVTADFYYSSQGQDLEERQSSTVTNQYVWGLSNINDLVLRDDSSITGSYGKTSSGLGRRIYFQQDANFNVTALTNTSGTVLQRYVYAPYGAASVLTAAWATTTDAYSQVYTYQGGRFDSATGMIHFGARDFSSSLGRWVQQDPAGYVDGGNLYRFVDDGPLSHTDPLGLWGWLSPGSFAIYNIPYAMFVWNYTPPSDDVVDGDTILMEFFNSVGPRDRYFGQNAWMTKVIRDADAVNRARSTARANLGSALRGKIDSAQPSSIPDVPIVQNHTDVPWDVARMLWARASKGLGGNMGFIGGYLGNVTIKKVACDHYVLHFHIDNTTSSQSGGGSGPADRPIRQHWDWDEDYYVGGSIGPIPKK